MRLSFNIHLHELLNFMNEYSYLTKHNNVTNDCKTYLEHKNGKFLTIPRMAETNCRSNSILLILNNSSN